MGTRANNNYIIFDSSYLVSLLDSYSPPHKQALVTFTILLERSDTLVYLLPDIVINESIVTLVKNGYATEKIKERMLYLTMRPKTIINSSDIISSFRRLDSNYTRLLKEPILPSKNRIVPKKITKTNDYIIACTALDYDAVVIGSDKQMLECLKLNDIRVFNFLADDFNLLKEYCLVNS